MSDIPLLFKKRFVWYKFCAHKSKICSVSNSYISYLFSSFWKGARSKSQHNQFRSRLFEFFTKRCAISMHFYKLMNTCCHFLPLCLHFYASAYSNAEHSIMCFILPKHNFSSIRKPKSLKNISVSLGSIN